MVKKMVLVCSVSCFSCLLGMDTYKSSKGSPQNSPKPQKSPKNSPTPRLALNSPKAVSPGRSQGDKAAVKNLGQLQEEMARVRNNKKSVLEDGSAQKK